MASWDTRSSRKSAKVQSAAVRAQLVQLVARSSPFWRDRLAAVGTPLAKLATPAGLERVPAVGERDICPDGDPAGAAALVLQSGESGFALHVEGPVLRRALMRRLVRPSAYAAVVEADTRPTTFVWAGQSIRFPVASTRGDLDVIARAGARMWTVLGLDRGDVLVGVTSPEKDAMQQALELMALGAGAPAVFAGPRGDDLAEALRLLPATVLAVPSQQAERLVDDLDEAGGPLRTVRTVLLLGAPTPQERTGVQQALARAGAGRVKVLGLHVADGHRLPWAQDSEGNYLTCPDLELLQLVNPETGEATEGPGELVVTQLGLCGSALVRWRTGDLVQSVHQRSGTRNVPCLVGLRRGALVPTLVLNGSAVPVDLRAVVGVLVGRADIADWRLQVRQDERRGDDQLLIHLVARGSVDLGGLTVDVARDVRAGASVLPTQVVVVGPRELPARQGGSRVLIDA